MARLHLVCCGTPTPTPSRFGSSYVLDVGDSKLMFDCGPAATWKLAKQGIRLTEIDHLFFTHHHYDHNIDYPCFLLCRWDHVIDGSPLKVYGPHPTAEITERLIGPQGAFSDDWLARAGDARSQEVYVARGGSLPRPQPKADVLELEGGETIDGPGWAVRVSRAVHLEPWMISLSYRVDYDGGAIVITGDTGPCSALDRLCENADTIVVNCWDHQDAMSSALSSGIGGTLDSAELAQRSGARRLVLAHQGPNLCRPGSPEKAAADIARRYEGEIIFGYEGLALNLA